MKFRRVTVNSAFISPAPGKLYDQFGIELGVKRREGGKVKPRLVLSLSFPLHAGRAARIGDALVIAKLINLVLEKIRLDPRLF